MWIYILNDYTENYNKTIVKSRLTSELNATYNSEVK